MVNRAPGLQELDWIE